MNAILTSNINILSSTIQRRSREEIVLSGFSGLFAGALGGGIGRTYNSLKGPLNQRAIRATNYFTGLFNGGADRLSNSIYLQEKPWQVIGNTVFGAAEGLYVGWWGNRGLFTNLSSSNIQGFAGRYVSSAITQIGTSIPGLGISIASLTHGVYYSFMGLGASGPLAQAGGFGFGGIGPPIYGHVINRLLYSTAIVYPLFFLDKNI
jgi:hypothetical protein